MANRIPLFIDFDRVLYDTDRLKEEIFTLFEGLGFAPEAVEEAYSTASDHEWYTPAKHLAALEKAQPSIEVEHANLLSQLDPTIANLLYPGAEAVLEHLNRKAYSPQLLTLGNPSYHEKKVVLSGVGDYFEKIHYTITEKWDYLQDFVPADAPFIIIDDRLDTIHRVTDTFPKALGIFRDLACDRPQFSHERAICLDTFRDLPLLQLPKPWPPLTV